MALSIYDRFITRTDSGATIGGASVTVTVPGTGALAQLYEDRDGEDDAANPFTADSDGRVQFYLAPGRYNISATGGGVTINYPDVLVGLEFVDGVQSVATIADLRLLEPTEDGQQAELLGHTVAGVGGGPFYYDESDTTTSDNNFNVIVTVGGKRWKRPSLIAYSVEMAGGRDNGVVDNKAAHEAVSAVTNLVFMPGSGTYLFSAPPTLPAGTTSVLNSDATVSGATLTQINAKLVDSGQLCGVPFAPEIRDKKIEIVCGTIRPQQNQAVTIEYAGSGGSSVVTQNNHGYSDGDWVYVSGVSSPHGEFMNGTKQIGSVTTNTYNILTGSGTPAGSVAGNVRKPGQWDWIKDGTHEPIGVVDTSPCIATDYTLVIPLTKTYSRVLSVVVCPDETISSAQNMSVGPSVALNGIALRASVDRTVAGVVWYNGSGWSVSMGAEQGIITSSGIAYASGNLTIPHSWCPGADCHVSPDTRAGAADPYIPCIRSTSNESSVINFISLATGGVYTGSGADVKMSFRFSKNYSSIIKLDGSDGSGAIGLHFGNVWFLGIMEV